MTISFFVPGIPAPGGSKRAFRAPHTGKIIVKDDCERNKSWRAVVALAGREACNVPLEGALKLTIVFYMPRPKGHFGAKGLKPSAPRYPTKKPDTTKLIRVAEDALTGICWADDAQVVDQMASKNYAHDQQGPGASIHVSQL